MRSTSSSRHASHDELLLARLAAGDLDDAARDRVERQLATCDECAALVADLGAIRDAIRELPTPRRRRDFRLTPADAARLRPRHGRGVWQALVGWSQPLGGMLAAAGLAGVLLSGAGLLPQAQSTAGQPDSGRFGYLAPSAPAGGQVPAAGPAGERGETGQVVESAAASAAAASAAASAASAASQAAAPSTAPAVVASGETADQQGSLNGSSASPAGTANVVPAQPMPATGGSKTANNDSTTSREAAGFDVRLAALLGSGLLFAVGLAILAAGPLLRRRLRP